jgi:hypothetical protein
VQLLKVNLKTDSSNHYTVNEEDVLGRCESQYSVNQMSSYVRVNKVRDLETCVEKPIVETGIFSGLPSTQKVGQLVLMFDYFLTTTVSDGRIFWSPPSAPSTCCTLRTSAMPSRSASANPPTSSAPPRRRTMLPLSTPGELVLIDFENTIMHSILINRQKLIFQNARPISQSLESDRLNKVQESLIYTVPNPILPSKYDRKMPENIQNVQDDDRVQVVDEMLTSIVNKMRTPFIDESVPAYLLKVNQLLRVFSTRDIMRLVQKYTSCSESDEVCYMKFETLLDCLPSICTDSAVEVVMNMIRQKTVNGFRAALMINTFAMTANPTPELINNCLVSEIQSIISCKTSIT